ncbi:MAG TPA: hypothetical protein VN843_27865 [Anaerolineales bacterium]|nr:hypothetical protein [Anaerolineales bacterium]
MWRFAKLAGLLIAGQVLLWTIVAGSGIWLSPMLDSIFEVFVFAYLPTIKLVELRGNYVGDSNIIYPIFYGVLLGIPIYGMVAAAAVCLLKRRK